jgi:aspartate-semialdehyde dehydrogenase
VGIVQRPASSVQHLTLDYTERKFRLAEIPVVSNAKNYRQNAAVPLVVPLVNPDHLNIIPTQRALHNLVRGLIVTNANCATTGLVVPLHALERAVGPIDKSRTENSPR